MKRIKVFVCYTCASLQLAHNWDLENVAPYQGLRSVSRIAIFATVPIHYSENTKNVKFLFIFIEAAVIPIVTKFDITGFQSEYRIKIYLA